METQQLLQHALELKSLLVGHGKVIGQISLIVTCRTRLASGASCSYGYINHLCGRAFQSNLTGSSGFTHQLLTKKSIAQGIRKAYHSVSKRKWNRIQELSATIIDAIDDDIAIEINAPPSPTQLRDVDELALTLTESYGQLCRSA